MDISLRLRPVFYLLVFIFKSALYSNELDINSYNIAEVLDLIEKTKQSWEDSSKSMSVYKTILEYALKNENSTIFENYYAGIAGLYWTQKQYEKAIKNYQIAITYGMQNVQNKNHLYQTLIANCLYLLHSYSLSLEYLSLAEKRAKEENDYEVRARIYSARSNIYLVLQLYELSDIAVNKGLELESFSIPKHYIGRFYERKADLLVIKKDYNSALKNFKLSLNYIDSNASTKNNYSIKSYVNYKIGGIWDAKNKLDLAKTYYQKAVLYADSASSPYYKQMALFWIANLEYQKKDYLSALKILIGMEPLIASIDLYSAKAKYYGFKGNTYLKLGEIDSASNNYKKSISISESGQKNFRVSDFRMNRLSIENYLYRRSARLYKKQINDFPNNRSYQDSLFKYLNGGRSRTLYEKKMKQSIPDKKYLESIENFGVFQRKIRLGGYNNIAEESIKLNTLKYELLSNRMENDTEAILGHKAISLSEFKSYLNQTNSATVIYSISGLDKYLVYIYKDTMQVIDLDLNLSSFKNSLHTFLKQCFFTTDYRNSIFNTKLSHELYLKLWKPLEDNQKLPKNIIIIPESSINIIPFDVLLSKADSVESYPLFTRPDFLENLLVYKHNFSILPSANLIKSFKPILNNNTIIFANPNYSTYTMNSNNHLIFEPLVYSKREAIKIKEIDNNALIFEKDKSTPKEFLAHASNSNLIHLATHAFIDTTYGIFSALALSLSDDSTDDGFLMGYEIDQLDLNCDLVTLSSCQSGDGRVLSGEGILGLPRIFFSAGARSTLMTLWKVDDKFTSELTPLFYTNMLLRGQSKIEALGNTKREIIKQYENPVNDIYFSHPFFWASFNLFGDIENNSIHDSKNEKWGYFILIVLFSFTLFIFIRKKYFL